MVPSPHRVAEPGSNAHNREQPSPEMPLRSSQVSSASRMPLPQIGLVSTVHWKQGKVPIKLQRRFARPQMAEPMRLHSVPLHSSSSEGGETPPGMEGGATQRTHGKSVLISHDLPPLLHMAFPPPRHSPPVQAEASGMMKLAEEAERRATTATDERR